MGLCAWSFLVPARFFETGVQMDAAELVDQAQAIFQTKPVWPVFHRQVFGPGGLISQLCATRAERDKFEKTPEHARLLKMLGTLRARPVVAGDTNRVITIRLPRSLHQALTDEARDRHTSMNQLCITKLLTPLQKDALVSDDGCEGAGRKPASIGNSAAAPGTGCGGDSTEVKDACSVTEEERNGDIAGARNCDGGGDST